MQRILGIDPGSHRTGFGIVAKDGRQLRVITSGTIKLPSAGALDVRLGELHRRLMDIFESHQPDLVAVEDVFNHRNARSALILAQARGVALGVAGFCKVEVEAFPPATVKRAVVGHGRAAKGQVQRMVQVLLGLATLPAEDEADALAVAICRATMGPHREPARAGPGQTKKKPRRGGIVPGV